MTELLGMLTSQLDVKEEQAAGGAGLLFKMAQEKLGSEFSAVKAGLPGVETLMKIAPDTEGASTGGLLGMAGSAISAFGGGSSDPGDLAKFAGAFDALGLDMSTVMKFAPIILDYAKSQGGEGVAALLKKAIG
jgi:hypothetical protein